MTVLVFGATGTAGSGILKACVGASAVREVRVIVRRPIGGQDSKLRTFVHQNFHDYSTVREAFVGIDACLYGLGISVRQTSGEHEYRQITQELALAAAREVKSNSTGAVFHFLSGEGASLDSRFMWARVKAETERDLCAMLPTVSWRPGFIDGDTPTGPRLYRAMRPAFRALSFIRSLYVSSEDIGLAMLQAQAEGIRSGVIGNREIRDLADRMKHAGGQ